MHRQFLLNKLSAYHAEDPEERRLLEVTRRFVEENEDCFERSLSIGHITGAGWVVNPDRTHALLTHHRKLNKWLQPGGHADGDSDVFRVALREVQEESGIDRIIPLSEDIFDIDVHEVPSHKKDLPHLHYDIRFLFEADMLAELKVTHESHDLQWIPMDRIKEYTGEASILRMVKKTFSWRP